jgi:hypothetical protein
VPQDRPQLDPLGLGGDPGVFQGLVPLEVTGLRRPDLLGADLLELADALGGGLVEHLVDRLVRRLHRGGVEIARAGVGEGRADQGRPQVAEVGDQVGDVEALAPAGPRMGAPLGDDVDGAAAQPIGHPVEQLGHVVGELAPGEPLGLGEVAPLLDRRPPGSMIASVCLSR